MKPPSLSPIALPCYPSPTPPMDLHRHATGPELLASAGAFLRAHEVTHSLLLGIVSRLTTVPQDPALRPYLASVAMDGAVLAVAVRTPPHQLVLSAIDAAHRDGALGLVANDLGALGTVLPGVAGPVGVADAFATRWALAHGQTARVHMAMREFALERVIPPAPVPGAMRGAVPDDLDLVHGWVHAFIDETGLPEADHAFAQPAMIADRIAQGRFWLWVLDGTVCGLAGSGGTSRVGRVGPVYTPPEARRQGYGSALVAALSQRLLDDGAAHATLSTDLANPTSNRIYQALGYHPTGDSVVMAFGP